MHAPSAATDAPDRVKAWAAAARKGYDAYLEWWLEQRLPFADMNLLEEVHGAGCFLERVEIWLDACTDESIADFRRRLHHSPAHLLGIEAYWAGRPPDRAVIRNLRLLGSIHRSATSTPAGRPPGHENPQDTADKDSDRVRP